jgi:DNA-binding beta-propeller fold protein YncE
MRNRTFTLALMIATIAGLLPQSGYSKKKVEPQQANFDPSTLVWPMPPDKPRVKFVEVWANNLQIEPIKKLSWADKLAGVSAKNVLEDFGKPAGVATDSKGRVYVTSLSRSLLYVIDKEHKQLLRINGGNGITFRTPVGVAVDEQDNFYVSDTQLHLVAKFNPQGQIVATFGSDDGMVAPAYMSVDDQRHRIYIADTRAQCVFVYDLTTLKLIQKVGKFGSRKDEFQYPVGVGVNRKDGTFAVTDTGSCSVKVFDADFKFVRKFGQQAMNPGNFVRPKGVAFDSQGNIWVADAAFNNFQIFSNDGHVRMFVGSTGAGAGQFQLPNGLYIDKNDRVYVSDQLNGRVQVFQFLGGN